MPYGLVTFTITGSFALTCDPGGGSMLVTVQFDATNTIEYLGLDDDSSTLVRPSPSNFDWAISAFSLVKSGIVICAAEAAADDEGAAGSGTKAGAELVADAGWVMVTVPGAVGLLPQDAIKVVAASPAASNEVAFFMALCSKGLSGNDFREIDGTVAARLWQNADFDVLAVNSAWRRRSIRPPASALHVQC
jgi:hypothetical protein